MEIASAYLSMAPTEPRGPSTVLSPLLPKAAAVRRGRGGPPFHPLFSSHLPPLRTRRTTHASPSPPLPQALELVARRFPGVVEAQLLLARTRYLAGELDAAARSAKAVLDLQPDKPEALLVQAQLHLARGNARLAMDHLEQAVSASFAVRETPAFNQAKAQALLALNENTSAVKRACFRGLIWSGAAPGSVRPPLWQRSQSLSHPGSVCSSRMQCLRGSSRRSAPRAASPPTPRRRRPGSSATSPKPSARTAAYFIPLLFHP